MLVTMDTQHESASPADPLSYTTEPPRQGVRVWAAAAILLGGIALIALGGCFLIGVMALYTNGFFGLKAAPPLGPGSYVLIAILYALAFGCFAGAVAVIVAGVSGLLRITHG